ncbi:MAG: hypothetical protein ACOCPN_02540 [Desulfonatronovibrionaceae bacterium]
MKYFWIFFIFVLVLASGCAPRYSEVRVSGEETVAVAEFSQPVHKWQLINNQVILDRNMVDEKVLEGLDSYLQKLLDQGPYKVAGPELVKDCASLEESRKTPGAAFHYWLRVGRCVPADYILVPFLFDWRERIGGEMGVEEPARVTLELNLIKISEIKLDRFILDERQMSLSEDLLGVGRFFKRGGKWISAESLAREGLERGVRELGL